MKGLLKFSFFLLLTLNSCNKNSRSLSLTEVVDRIDVTVLDEQMAKVRDYVPLYSNIAFRGTTFWAPEQTEVSYRWAREIGADYIQAEVQCTKDKVIVAFADDELLKKSDCNEVFKFDNVTSVRRTFYKSFKNRDGSQHFSDNDIENQIQYDKLNESAIRISDFYYAELLILDAGQWFNDNYVSLAKEMFSSDGSSLAGTYMTGGSSLCYSNGQYISSLQDIAAIARGSKLSRDFEGRRILPYHIKAEYSDLTLEQIRQLNIDINNKNTGGTSISKFMDFVEYDYKSGYISDDVDSGNRPGICITLKEYKYQPIDIEDLLFNELDYCGWNIVTNISSDTKFYNNGKVNIGNTNGKVILQTFRLNFVERIESKFEGRVPMCYLIDNERPIDWSYKEYFDKPWDASKVIDYAITHKCHIIGPGVSGGELNLQNRCNDWQIDLIHKAKMPICTWLISENSQMNKSFDVMVSGSIDLVLNWQISNQLRCSSSLFNPFHSSFSYDNSEASLIVPDPMEVLISLEKSYNSKSSN